MFSSKEILTTATEKKLLKTTATVNNKFISTATVITDKQIDLALKDNADVISNEFKGWYCKCIKNIGCSKFYDLAKLARENGNNKCRYFSWLLKREIQTY